MAVKLSLDWDEVLDQLRLEVNDEDFEHWLSPLRLRSCQPGLVTLSVPNTYYKDYLDNHYRELVGEIVQRHLGEDHRIRIVAEDFPSRTHRAERAAPRNDAYEWEYPLNKRYTFDTFVVGPNNTLAHAAAKAVAASPAEAYNPLFIYGGTGLGKTHVMQAIGHYVLDHHRGMRVAFLPAEQFIHEFIESIKKNDQQGFKAKFRNVDVLLIDDVHFLAGREATQEEFFHTFNALHNAHKQIVISSDRPPKDIPTLESRLRSRFEWGLIVDISAPDLETRIAILRKKCEQEGLSLPDDVINFIANRIKLSVRELESALVTILCYMSSYKGAALDVEVVSKLLGDLYHNEHRNISIDKIQKKVAEHFRVKTADILGANRSRMYVVPRQVAMYLCKQLTRHSYPEIGTFFGKKDHTTVMHACRKVEQMMADNDELRHAIERLAGALRSA
ncbi:chromosomal replication initiator protein DnaA [bacterium]|nr:chromosomal replication initiator protein DnaA [bacterium]